MDCCGERRGGAKESTNSYIAKFTQYLPNTRKNGRVMGIYPYLTTHQNSVRRSTQYPITQQKTEWVHIPGGDLEHSIILTYWVPSKKQEQIIINNGAGRWLRQVRTGPWAPRPPAASNEDPSQGNFFILSPTLFFLLWCFRNT